MNRIRALLVDDEPLARKTLRHLLTKAPDVEIIGECRNGVEAVKHIRAKKPDVVFLDVQMPEMDGFDVVRAIGAERMPVVVFVTAYDRYAIEAFDSQAVDYLLKPFEDSRFERALRRAKAALHHKGMAQLTANLVRLLEVIPDAPPTSGRGREGGAARYPLHLLIKSRQKILFLRTDDIDWIKAANYYAEIHANSRSFIHRETLNELEKKLDPAKFFRTHRSAIVNLERIRELRPHQNGTCLVVLQDNTELSLSRGRREQLEHLL